MSGNTRPFYTSKTIERGMDVMLVGVNMNEGEFLGRDGMHSTAQHSKHLKSAVFLTNQLYHITLRLLHQPLSRRRRGKQVEQTDETRHVQDDRTWNGRDARWR